MNFSTSLQSGARLTALGVIGTLAPAVAQNEPVTGIDPVGPAVSIYGNYDPDDHEGVHSSLPLQANLAGEKWAAVLDGANGVALASFRTVYFINNPSSTDDLEIEVEIHTADGANSYVETWTLAPNEVKFRPISVPNPNPATDPGLGNLRATVTPGSVVREFVGSTLYFANGEVADFFNPGDEVDLPTGEYMASMQPLQEAQAGSNRISFGPFPAYTTATSPVDIVNGLFSFVNIVNPLPNDRNVILSVFGTTSGFLGSANVILRGHGALQDAQALAQARSVYSGSLPEQEFIVLASATDNGPLVGDAVMLDLFSNDSPQGGGGGTSPLTGGTPLPDPGAEPVGGGVPGAQLGVGTRARMTSFMATYTPVARLFNSELTVEGNTITTMGIYNMSRTPAALNILYYNRNNALIGQDTVPATTPLNPLGAIVIGPGMPLSPNFPGTGVFSGSVRVFASRANPSDRFEPLIAGWANRGAENTLRNQMYGELLIGPGGLEQTRSFTASNGDESAVISLAFDVGPSYATFLNDIGAGTGSHSYDFFERNGGPAGTGNFPNLGGGRTSFTYEDAIINVSDVFHSGVVAARNLLGSGISTIGGSLFGRQIVDGAQGYRGPGDTVPPL